MSRLEDQVERPLTEQIRNVALNGKVSLLPLPRVSRRLLSLLEDRDRADSRLIADLVRTDSVITSALLRMANSAFFGGLERITDLSQAISRIGLNRVGSMVTTLVHKGQFRTDEPARREFVERLWDHAVAAALAARRLAVLAGADPEESYLAGLLHDIGKLLALKAADHLAEANSDFEITAESVDEVLEAVHPELGFSVLTQWRLPDSICKAVLSHHDESPGIREGLVLRVQAADAISRKLGAHPRPAPDLVLEEVGAVERLDLTDLELATLLVDLEDEIRDVMKLI